MQAALEPGVLRRAAHVCVWYVCSVAATIATKQLFRTASVGPDSLTACQFLIGAIMSIIQICAASPASSAARFSLNRFWPSSIASSRLLAVALVYCAGHLFTNWSFFGVEASFAHTIKALEPAFTVVVSACMGSAVPRRVVVATLPILFGVWLASVAEVSFSILGLVCGLLSNLCFAVRNVATPSSPAAAADGDALFLAINIIATALASVWFFISRPLLPSASLPPPPPPHKDSSQLAWLLLLCGSSHFMYNYSSFAFLAATSPITHSVANCMRRIFVVAVSLLYFRNPVSALAVTGTAIALAGVWLFTYVKNTSATARSALVATTVEEIKSI